jgi:uncharacterized membrane protein YkoI
MQLPYSIKEKIMNKISIGASIIAMAFATSAVADPAPVLPKTKYDIEHCIKQALQVKPGLVSKSELKFEDRTRVYEFTIDSENGQVWDVECDTSTGKVIEIEEQVANTDDPKFKSKMKISEAEARKTALKAYPGKVVKVEYEIEEDGAVTYEFDIVKDKLERKIEVDATSGKIVENELELNQIGPE